VVHPNGKVPYLYFKVVDPKLQVADLKAEGELRSGGIPHPNLTPVLTYIRHAYFCLIIPIDLRKF